MLIEGFFRSKFSSVTLPHGAMGESWWESGRGVINVWCTALWHMVWMLGLIRGNLVTVTASVYMFLWLVDFNSTFWRRFIITFITLKNVFVSFWWVGSITFTNDSRGGDFFFSFQYHYLNVSLLRHLRVFRYLRLLRHLRHLRVLLASIQNFG